MKHSKKIAALIILLLMCAVLINPERYLSSVKDGVILFWAAVLPALFPFFFFTRMLTGLGFPETVGKFFEKPVKFLFHTPPISAYIFFMSVLSGYPIGAKLISEFYKNGVINTEESKKIIAFSSTSAPLFVIGTLGVFMLDNVSYGVIILLSHYLSAIITGLVFCNVRRLKATNIDVKPRVKPLPDNVIGDSINDSVLSVLSVGGLIAIFSLVIDVLYDLKFFDLFGNDARRERDNKKPAFDGRASCRAYRVHVVWRIVYIFAGDDFLKRRKGQIVVLFSCESFSGACRRGDCLSCLAGVALILRICVSVGFSQFFPVVSDERQGVAQRNLAVA